MARRIFVAIQQILIAAVATFIGVAFAIGVIIAINHETWLPKGYTELVILAGACCIGVGSYRQMSSKKATHEETGKNYVPRIDINP